MHGKLFAKVEMTLKVIYYIKLTVYKRLMKSKLNSNYEASTKLVETCCYKPYNLFQ